MKGQQRFIIGLVLALILIVFALLNGQDVSVNFFGIQLKWPLIVIIAVSVSDRCRCDLVDLNQCRFEC